MNGLMCLRIIREQHPDVKVVMLSASELRSRQVNPRDLASALRQIVEGVVYQTGPDVAGIAVPTLAPVATHAPACDLTARELTMLEAISRGLSTKAISRELWITDQTVKFHLTNIYRKLGVSNRTSAMRYAIDHDLVGTLAAARDDVLLVEGSTASVAVMC